MTEPVPRNQDRPRTAEGWVKWHSWMELAFGPVTRWVLEAVRAAPGTRALDLGCGTGIPALALAQAIGPAGNVTAIDVDADMLAGASENARRQGLENLQVREMNVDQLEFGEGSFDLVTSTFLLMFRPDPLATVRGVRRVLEPKGRLAVVVWDTAEKNPFFTSVFEPVRRFVALPPSEPKGPGSFRLGGDELERVLRGGGFSEFRIERLAFSIAFESLAEHWACLSATAPPVKAATEALSGHELGLLKADIAESLRPYLEGQRVVLPAAAVCALAIK